MGLVLSFWKRFLGFLCNNLLFILFINSTICLSKIILLTVKIKECYLLFDLLLLVVFYNLFIACFY
ncbi:MAG: hypothetical protein UR12_C0010G0019 [candidate division TM6 bacterium GW2011_GWF2_30_66]|nr:MAG: hypothetical protein UR12_C0010G0019 [candidate division TM6 bacterium GW2011_GWF2_30_66]